MFLTKVRPNINRRPVVVNNNFDQLFNQLFTPPTTKVSQKRVSTQRPAVNVIEADDHFRIDVATPGLGKEDFTIHLEKDTLTISAKKKEEEGTETATKEKYIRREFQHIEFKRNFHLPKTIDTDKIKATMKNGILSLTLAKKEEAKELPARKVEIA